MGIVVTIFPEPKIYLSLVAGGSLTVGQEYFFIGFFSRGSSYYGNSTGTVSEEMSITPTAGNQSIKAEWWYDGGDYTQVVQNGSDITITETAHGRSVNDTVYLRGGNYDGEYTITAVTTDTFDITANYSADDAGKWFADIGRPEHSQQIVFKWDKYSMINAGTSEPYQWLNMNDPANTGSEWDGTYGHRKWTCRYYINSTLTGTENTWIKEATEYNGNDNELHDGEVVGTSRYRDWKQPAVSFRDNSSYFAIDSHFPRDSGTLCVMFDGDGDYGTDDLMDALLNSPYTDHYYWSNKSDGYSDWVGSPSVMIFGSMFSNYTDNTELTDLQITTVGGQAFYRSYSNRATLRRCTLNMVTIGNNSWANPEITAYDSVINQIGNAFIIDNLQGSGIAPKATGTGMTFYGSADGFDMIGGNDGGYPFFQYRYYNEGQTFTNMYVKDLYVYATATGSGATDTMTWDNAEFVNEGLQSYDVRIYYGYMDDIVIDETFDCTDVTNDRPDGYLRINRISTDDPTSIASIFEFKYNNAFHIVDVNGDDIEGATVQLTDKDGTSYSDNTDADGEVTLKTTNYTNEYDDTDPDGWGYDTKTTELNNFSLIITKSGYKTYKVKNLDLGLIPHIWTITLKPHRFRETRSR